MARIRTVKPSFWGDQKIAVLSRDARLLFLGLISMADDHGRFLASHQAVAGYVFPNDLDVTVKKLAAWMAELQQQGLIIHYNGGRIHYGAIPNWSKHQKISHKQPSSLPPPPTGELF